MTLSPGTLRVVRTTVSTFSRIVLLLFFTTSCQQKSDPEYFVQWVQDYENGLHVEKAAEGFLFDLQYEPSAFRAILAGADFSAQQTSSSTADALDHFQLKVSAPAIPDLYAVNAASAEDLQRHQYYFDFQFQNDIVLKVGDHEYACVAYHAEPTPDSKGRHTFHLGFESAADIGDKAQLIIQSSYFSSFPVKINISKSNLTTLSI